jgi:hypothetical protein
VPILLIVGVLVVVVVILLSGAVWRRGQSARNVAELRAEHAGSLRWGPGRGNCSRATARCPHVKGMAIIAVTDTALFCRRLVGAPFQVPLDRVKEVSENPRFLSACHGGVKHLILTLDDGVRVGFIVRDVTGLRAAINRGAGTPS